MIVVGVWLEAVSSPVHVAVFGVRSAFLVHACLVVCFHVTHAHMLFGARLCSDVAVPLFALPFSLLVLSCVRVLPLVVLFLSFPLAGLFFLPLFLSCFCLSVLFVISGLLLASCCTHSLLLFLTFNYVG